MVCLALNFFIKPCPYGGALFLFGQHSGCKGPRIRQVRPVGVGQGLVIGPEHVLQPGVAGLLLELSLIPGPDGRGIRPGQNQVPNT